MLKCYKHVSFLDDYMDSGNWMLVGTCYINELTVKDLKMPQLSQCLPL